MQLQNSRRLPRSSRSHRRAASPTPAEIRERCLAIQKEWSPEERSRRWVRHWDLEELLLASRLVPETSEAA